MKNVQSQRRGTTEGWAETQRGASFSAPPRLRVKFILAMLLLILLAACGGSQDLETPPDIRYGEDVCEECSMIINEPRHAASYVLTDGTVRRFDDIGEMLAYDSKHHEAVHVYWVHDFNSEEWIMADKASFVLHNEAKTPMGWGLLAFGEESSAAAYMAEVGGAETAWADLQTAVANGELDPATLSAHIHDHDMTHDAMEKDHEMQNHQSDG